MQTRSPRETADIEQSPFDPRSLLAGAALTLSVMALVGLGIFFFTRDNDITDAVAGDDGSTTTTTAAGDQEATTTVEGADTDVVEGDPPDTQPSGEVQVLSVALDDPLSLTPATAGTDVQLDPVTGEICYSIAIEGMESPYDGHIHVGPPGVKGGIVVDLGALSGTDPTGCVANAPIDTQAILADLGGHYVEFHDPDGTRTIRAQLAMIDPATTVETAEDGAVIMIEANKISLVGDVPDQVTIDKLVETFADIDLGSATLDTAGLNIVEGSSRPSGRIVVDDAVLFGVDSDQLPDGEIPVLDTLATIFRARPAWQLTVVGHTDDTGPTVYNLELSLRRAGAVRTALEARGVPADSLQVEGAGATQPIFTNDSEDGRAQNRRIEFVIQAG